MYRTSEEEVHLCAEDIELAHRSEESEEEHSTELSNTGHFFRGGLVVAAMLGVFALATVHLNSKMASTSSGTYQEKAETGDFSTQASVAATTAANSVYGPSPAPPGTAKGFSSFFGPSPAPAASESVAAVTTASTAASTADAQNSQVVPSATASPLTPDNDLNDGNKCNDDEESLGTLCYQKCSILTNGAQPVRISAFGCAKSKNLGDVIGEKIPSFIPCQGYDVAGKAEGNGCPHSHGGCLTDEELSLECLNPANFKMDFKFAVGGGEDVHKGIHDPIKSVTET